MGRGKHLNGKTDDPADIGTRDEMLRILTEMARKGSVSAATTLVRELRHDEEKEKDEVGDAIGRILETEGNGARAEN